MLTCTHTRCSPYFVSTECFLDINTINKYDHKVFHIFTTINTDPKQKSTLHCSVKHENVPRHHKYRLLFSYVEYLRKINGFPRTWQTVNTMGCLCWCIALLNKGLFPGSTLLEHCKNLQCRVADWSEGKQWGRQPEEKGVKRSECQTQQSTAHEKCSQRLHHSTVYLKEVRLRMLMLCWQTQCCPLSHWLGLITGQQVADQAKQV